MLKGKVDALVRMLYSKKSEKLDPNQLNFLEDFESKKDEAPISDESTEARGKAAQTNNTRQA